MAVTMKITVSFCSALHI